MATQSPNQVEQLSFSLAILLGHTAVFSQLLHNFHWNYVGVGFNYIHKFLDEDYSTVYDQVDPLAELIITLGYQPPSSMAEYIKLSSGIKEMAPTSDRNTILSTALAGHNLLGQVCKQVFTLADDIDANDVANFVADLQGYHYKQSWWYRAELGQSIPTLY